MFDNLIDIEFNGTSYKATAEYDKYLSTMYGAYMHLPPDQGRIYGYAPMILDFEYSY